MRRKAIVANWKMNMDSASIGEFCSKIQDMTIKDDVIIGICVPALYFTQVKTALDKSKIKIGAQNAYFEEKGAYTGEISAAMLQDPGLVHLPGIPFCSVRLQALALAVSRLVNDAVVLFITSTARIPITKLLSTAAVKR